MKCRIKVNLIVLIVAIIIIFILLFYRTFIILPVNSNQKMLTLVKSGYPCIERITMKHYVNDVNVADYILDLTIKLRGQQPQEYKLPMINNGRVDVCVELNDGTTNVNNKTLLVSYDNANYLYNSGLLIFLDTDYNSSTYVGDFICYNQYTYFISGKECACYFEKAGLSEWDIINDPPQLKRINRIQNGYNPQLNYLWRENEWVVYKY